MNNENEVIGLTFIGKTDDYFRTIAEAAHQLPSFGTTVADSRSLDVVLNDDANIEDIMALIETAQQNGAFLNGTSAKMLSSRFGFKYEEDTDDDGNPDPPANAKVRLPDYNDTLKDADNEPDDDDFFEGIINTGGRGR